MRAKEGTNRRGRASPRAYWGSGRIERSARGGSPPASTTGSGGGGGDGDGGEERRFGDGGSGGWGWGRRETPRRREIGDDGVGGNLVISVRD